MEVPKFLQVMYLRALPSNRRGEITGRRTDPNSGLVTLEITRIPKSDPKHLLPEFLTLQTLWQQLAEEQIGLFETQVRWGILGIPHRPRD